LNFKDVCVNRADRYCLGVEQESGKYYVAIPVRNDFVDYEEYYEISPDQFADFRQDAALALTFVIACRDRKEDARLMIKPGRLRGWPT
jgi:hypothetical protein